MTRQDFILIATVLADASPANATERSFLSALVVDFANKLQGTNPAFNRALFIQAATGVVAVNARKVKRVCGTCGGHGGIPGARDLTLDCIECGQPTQPRTLASDLAEDR